MKTSSTKPDIGNTSVKPMLSLWSKRTFRLVLPVVLALVGGGFLSPQSLSPQQQPSSVSTVLITARSKGDAAIELSAADLEIKEDGKQATVMKVRRVNGAPLHYCIVFDVSRSTSVAFGLQQKAATELLARTIQPGRDRGWFVPFNDEVYPGPETDNPQLIMRAIAQEGPRGATALYDAMISCADLMSESASDPGLRAMFIFSDGEDDISRSTGDAVVPALEKAGTRAYVIGQKSEPAHNLNPSGVDVLKKFAKSTGGTACFPRNEKEVEQAVRDIADELASAFLVEYAPAGQKRDGKLHKLKVMCSKTGVSITAPDHRYAPKQ